MATKTDILSELSGLPVARLERLLAYSKYIIIPTEDLLVNVTMQQMREKGLSLADENFPEWTDRSATDFGMFLMEHNCVISEKDFWYLNAFAEQSLHSKMVVYSMAWLRSSELGYRPTVHIGSTVSVDLDFPAGAAYTYQIGELTIEVDGGIKFTNIATFNVPLGAATVSTTLRQGEYFKESVTFNGRSVDIRRPGVNIDTLVVTVDGIPYQRVAVFGNSGSSSTHYMVLPEEDGKCSVYFGEDDYGKKPRIGALIEVQYVSGFGADGNFDTNLAAKINKSNSTRSCDGVVIVTSGSGDGAHGGLNSPTIAELRNETKVHFNYRKSLLNIDAATEWLLNQPEISKAKVTVQGAVINIYFIDKVTGINPVIGIQNNVVNRMTPLVPLGYSVSYNTTTLVSTSTTVLTISYLKGFDSNEITTQVKQTIQDYTNPLVSAQYGKDYDLSELVATLKNTITGVQNAIFTTVAGVGAANIVVADTFILDKIDFANITVNLVAI